MKSRRSERLAAPRPINDPEHGDLGVVQKAEGGKWSATTTAGLELGHYLTERAAINALCDAKRIPHWFARWDT